MTIEKRIERIEAILDARGLDWDHPMAAEEPAKEAEPEHPAGPMPDPGEGYRIVSKDPPEDLQPGDDYELAPGVWVTSEHARTHKIQYEDIWYRRKIEPPKDEYREPVLPGDACKECQFSDDGIEWRSGWLNGWVHRSHQWISHSGGHWRHCRIKVDA